MGDENVPDRQHYRPGQVVDGHVLHEDGTEWIHVANSDRAANGRAGLNKWLIPLLALGLIAVGGLAVAYRSYVPNTSSGTEPDPSPAQSAPAWVPAFEVWIEDVQSALDRWDVGAQPLKDYYTIGAGVTVAYPPTLWDENHRTMADAVDQMYRVANGAPSEAPEEITGQMALVAQAYDAKYDAYRDLVRTSGLRTPEAQAAEKDALARLDQASRQAENAMAAMWDSLIRYWPGAAGTSPPPAI